MKFNIDEIFEMAEQIERNGAKFYRRAVEIVTNEHAQEMLKSLAAMEDEHERTYAEMRAALVKPDERRETMYEGDDTAAQYIRAWADRHVFEIDGDVFADLTGSETLLDILNAAIKREKESIILFESLKSSLTDEADKARVDRIIKEEVEHIGLLSRERQAATGG